MASRQAVIDIPEEILLAEKTDETSFAREVLALAAVKLYELGRLSSGRAAELRFRTGLSVPDTMPLSDRSTLVAPAAICFRRRRSASR